MHMMEKAVESMQFEGEAEMEMSGLKMSSV